MIRNLIGVKELAEKLDVPISWVYARTRPGAKGTAGPPMPHYCIGKYRKFKLDEVEAWIETQRVLRE